MHNVEWKIEGDKLVVTMAAIFAARTPASDSMTALIAKYFGSFAAMSVRAISLPDIPNLTGLFPCYANR